MSAPVRDDRGTGAPALDRGAGQAAPLRDKAGHLVTPAGDRPARAGFLASFKYAAAGVLFLFRTQRNARVHLAAAIFFTLFALWLGLTPSHFAILWAIMTLVVVAEAVNTSVEAVVDLATDRYHPLAKIAKDTAAGAVLLAALGAVAVGVALFLPPLLDRLGAITGSLRP